MHPRKKYRLPAQRSRKRVWAELALLLFCIAVVIGCVWLWRLQTTRSTGEGRTTEQRVPTAAQPGEFPEVATRTTLVATQPVSIITQVQLAVPRAVYRESFPRPVRTVFEAQIALVRLGISPGLIDGLFGPQTSAAIAVYQQKYSLPVTGRLDEQTKAALTLKAPPLTNYVLTRNDVARLQPLSSTWLGKSRQSALEYESVLELVAEKTFSHPAIIQRLNPQINWANLCEGTALVVPHVWHPTNSTKAAFIRISLSARALQAFDPTTNLLVHFPCSIARRAEKRPVGELHVTSIVPNPNYTFDPTNFPESIEARQLTQKLILPPGPNNPVGVAWIGLDRPGYGIHGTAAPERIGHSESHGCFRLANWNAEHLLSLVWTGMPVYVEP